MNGRWGEAGQARGRTGLPVAWAANQTIQSHAEQVYEQEGVDTRKKEGL